MLPCNHLRTNSLRTTHLPVTHAQATTQPAGEITLVRGFHCGDDDAKAAQGGIWGGGAKPQEVWGTGVTQRGQ